ncbi:hypothetical protein V2J09_020268 [Rumex salicifolius]
MSGYVPLKAPQSPISPLAYKPDPFLPLEKERKERKKGAFSGTNLMAFEAYSDSKYQSPFQVNGEMMHPSGSEYLLQDGSSLSEPSYGNLSRMVAAARLSRQLGSNDIDPRILADIPYFASSMEKNTLFTGFPSHTDGSYMNSSNSYMESYLNLPSRPGTLSNPSAINSLGVNHLLVPVQGRAQQSTRQQNQRSVLSPMSQSMQANEVAVPSLMKFDCSGPVQKKPRLDPTKDDVIRYMIQQILLSESSKELRSQDSKLIASPRQYQFPNALQKETIHLPPKSTEAPGQQSVSQVPMICRQIQALEPQVSPKSVPCGGIYADQLMQYLHRQRQRPKQNNIAFWRNFVTEFFDSNATKRWCLSKYDQVACHAHFAFSRSAVAKFEVLPRLFKVNFENGIVDELLYLNFPCESKLPMGCIELRYTKAVQETVYKNSRVVHEGQLCVTFTKELKIISWVFCARHHEEFVLRRSIAPQVKQLVQVSQKYQNNIDRNKSGGNLTHAMQATHNRFIKAGQQLEKTLDSHVTELGLSKQLARFLQVAEVIDCMKNLISFSHENNLSPIESLNRYAENTKFKANQVNQHALQQDSQGFFFSTGNKPMPMSSIPTQNVGNRSVMINRGGEEACNSNSHSSQQTSFGIQVNTDCLMSPWNSYQSLLTRNSKTSSESMMMANHGSPHSVIPSSSSASKSMMHYSDSNGIQGDQDHRKNVLNKLMMQKMFSNGAFDQEPQLPMSSLPAQNRGNTTMFSNGAFDSQTKTCSQLGPGNGPKTGNSASKLRGQIKKEMDEMEEFGVPMLPGVQVKNVFFHGQG